MRKLHELLPIARSYLVTVTTSPADSIHVYRLYTCYSAELAQRDRALDREEVERIQRAITSELSAQGFKGAIACAAEQAGIDASSLRGPEYIEFRDAWLDEFQAKLVREDR